MAENGSTTTPQAGDTRAGFLFALAAYLLWGFLPLYMKAVAHIPPAEVVAHRTVWSVPIAAAVILWIGRTAELKAAIRDPRMLAQAVLTAAVLSINWGLYVWAIGAGRALETALGYYINPLFSIFLAFALLGERLRPLQYGAIGLALLAVLIVTWGEGVPWVSLALTFSWGFYAYFRRALPIGPNQGFLLEVLILLPLALAYILWAEWSGKGHFFIDPGQSLLLMFSGVVTAVPLMLYANGAKLLRLSTIGIMQYIAPSMIFVIAIFLFGEPFDAVRAVAFALIWAALVLYSMSMFAGRSRGG